MRFRPVDQVAVTPAQRAIVWFLFVSSLLFVLQTLTGGLIAHYRAEPEGFFGIDFSAILPFNIVRTWHVQLAIFWVSASYLATGIFIVPLIAGRERSGQGALTVLLLIAVAIVVFGSLAGEYAGARGWLGEGLWFWLGHQGWEYLDLGRLWQILLVIGLFLWVFILFRGLRGTLARATLRQHAVDALLCRACDSRLLRRRVACEPSLKDSSSMISGVSGWCISGSKIFSSCLPR